MERVREFICRFLFIIFRIFPIKKNKVVVINFYGNGYGDNPKYICEELIKTHEELDVIWLVNKMDDVFPNQIRKVKYKSIKAIYEMATAKIWIDNARKRKYVIKRNGQYYIQTWHGGIRIKEGRKGGRRYTTKILYRICQT